MKVKELQRVMCKPPALEMPLTPPISHHIHRLLRHWQTTKQEGLGASPASIDCTSCKTLCFWLSSLCLVLGLSWKQALGSTEGTHSGTFSAPKSCIIFLTQSRNSIFPPFWEKFCYPGWNWAPALQIGAWVRLQGQCMRRQKGDSGAARIRCVVLGESHAAVSEWGPEEPIQAQQCPEHLSARLP